MLKELRLPAAVAKVVLSGAVQDFIDEVRPTDDSDWLTLVRTARAVHARADRGLRCRRPRRPDRSCRDTGRRVPDPAMIIERCGRWLPIAAVRRA